MFEQCKIEIFIDGAWHTAGKITLLGDRKEGINARARFEYDPDYLDNRNEKLDDTSYWAVSCRYPISYELFDEKHWPPFLLDIMPSGAARRGWETILNLTNTASSDWELLTRGGGNPPGHLRVAEAVLKETAANNHPGFAYKDILDRREEF